jgi:hypothetical protein
LAVASSNLLPRKNSSALAACQGVGATPSMYTLKFRAMPPLFATLATVPRFEIDHTYLVTLSAQYSTD